ncbi:MAG: hypothetical protein ABI614_02410 [Planctomycetota bacterium]
MTKRDRGLERIAWRLFELLGTTQCKCVKTDLPSTAWQECERLSRLIGKAQARGWLAAAEHMLQQFTVAQQTLMDRLEATQRALNVSQNVPHRLTLNDIYHDLAALQAEFANVEFDQRSDELTVTTDEIVIEDLHFGQFAIVLECNQVGDVSPYRVEATDANPASGSSQTTHPHVQNDTLCEGEGRVPIERALRQGRLFDFFLIVRQILENYNPDSAYVRIADWHGLTCQDCGSSMDEEERDTCFGCETDLCNDCSNGCQRCSERFCNGCTEACEVCHEYYCQACLQRCDECELLYCEDCKTHEKCPNCVEKQEAEAEKCNSANNTPVHAVCVGEVAVSS